MEREREKGGKEGRKEEEVIVRGEVKESSFPSESSPKNSRAISPSRKNLHLFRFKLESHLWSS